VARRRKPGGARVTGYLIAALTVLSTVLGCRGEPVIGPVICLVDQPVSGYACPLAVESPQARLSFTWDFGDGTTWSGGPETLHVWASPGEYEVRAVSEGTGTWEESFTVIGPVAAPTDLVGSLGLEKEDVSRIAVYRPRSAEYTVIYDPLAVERLIDLLSDAQPTVPTTQGASVVELHLVDSAGVCLGSIGYAGGLTTVMPKGAEAASEIYLLRESLLPFLAQQSQWRSGAVVDGRAQPLRGQLPWDFLPSEWLGLSGGGPVPGNVVETYGLKVRGTLTIETTKSVLVRLDASWNPSDYEYILSLLAASRPLEPAETADYPEEWYGLPRFMLCIRGQAETDLDLGFVPGLGCFWARGPTGDVPERVFLITPVLERFLEHVEVLEGA